MSDRAMNVFETMVGKHTEKMSFPEAVQQAVLDLEGLIPDLQSLAQEVLDKESEETYRVTKISEINTSHELLDHYKRRWYIPGPPDEGLWGSLRSHLLESLPEKSVQEIDQSSNAIMAWTAEPKVHQDRRLGLVVGNVQSGKTANYSAVVSKALDKGYKLVIVLSGIHNNLRKQTQKRLERDLGVADDARNWHLLTSEDADFGTSEAKNAGSILQNSTRVLAVVKKNKTRLENLLRFLRSADEGVKRATPILIIDDESDQATPDASAEGELNPTTISRLMREIWAEVTNGTYIGYTATPFANVFIDPKPDDELPTLYPRSFIHVMPTPTEYFGAERIFGLDLSADEFRDQDGPDVVRVVDPDELPSLMPRKRRGEDSASSPEVTESLSTAIRWFIVAAAVRRVRGQADKHSTMLIHTTHQTDPHFAMKEAVEEFLEPLREDAREGDVDSFRVVFHEEMDRAAELYRGTGAAATWPRVRDEIPNVIRSLRVSVDNSRADQSQRLDYKDHEPQTVIVIGGGTLSRGLTLEGLFVSFFTRTSNTYDTLLQMGRWFGYRKGYEDLQRIWVSPGLDGDYRFLASVENELRQDIKRMIASDQTPADIGIRVAQHPGRLQITNPNKMKHAEKVEVDFEGYRPQTYVFDAQSSRVIDGNVEVVRSLLRRIGKYSAPVSSGANSRLFADVPLSELREFFEDFATSSEVGTVIRDAVRWSAEKLPGRRWNVVLAGGSTKETFSAGEFSVPMVRRAPIRDTDPTADGSTINIRALMSGADTIADLRVSTDSAAGAGSDRLSRDDQISLRKRSIAEGGAGGRGLLLIYPISRMSKSTSATRISMDVALRKANPEILTEGADPLMGIGLVTPFDINNEIANKGTYLAVRPAFESDHEEIDETDHEPDFVDTEDDYQGEQ